MNRPKQTATYTIVDPLEHNIQLPLDLCTNDDGSINDETVYDDLLTTIAKSTLLIKKERPEESYYSPLKDRHLLLITADSNHTLKKFYFIKSLRNIPWN